MTQERIEQLDYMKGIGIFFVILGHCILLDGKSSIISEWIYSFHMPLFFFASGIGMRKSNDKNINKVFVKGIKGLIFPYLCWSCIYIVLFAVTDGIKTIPDNLYKTLTGRGIAPLWFLPALFLAKLSFVFIRASIDRIGLYISREGYCSSYSECNINWK